MKLNITKVASAVTRQPITSQRYEELEIDSCEILTDIQALEKKKPGEGTGLRIVGMLEKQTGSIGQPRWCDAPPQNAMAAAAAEKEGQATGDPRRSAIGDVDLGAEQPLDSEEKAGQERRERRRKRKRKKERKKSK